LLTKTPGLGLVNDMSSIATNVNLNKTLLLLHLQHVHLVLATVQLLKKQTNFARASSATATAFCTPQHFVGSPAKHKSLFFPKTISALASLMHSRLRKLQLRSHER
jgi:hypothetical protein